MEIPTGYEAEYSYTVGGNSTGHNYINAAAVKNDSEGIMTITNKPITYTNALTTAGGRGTAIYSVAGGMMLILSAVGYVQFKRRRQSEE